MTEKDEALLSGNAEETLYLIGWLSCELAKAKGLTVPELVASIPPYVKPPPDAPTTRS